jgi:electron transport complex protein RnfD
VAAAFYFFGVSALLVIAAACAGALGAEAALGSRHTLTDGSALITGILLGLTLPASLPLWMAAIGGFVSIALGKRIFGGLGYNIFNPALLGRAFLMAAFPVPLTTWPAPVTNVWALAGDNFALPLMSADPAAMVTAATPLGLAKFEHVYTPVMPLLLGTTAGSLGETAAIVILVCGGYLAWRGFLNWRTPASIFATVALLSGVIQSIDPSRPGPLFMLFSGGLVLGAVYMATDMVTSPTTNKGRWIFGAGIGVLVVVIRLWGGCLGRHDAASANVARWRHERRPQSPRCGAGRLFRPSARHHGRRRRGRGPAHRPGFPVHAAHRPGESGGAARNGDPAGAAGDRKDRGAVSRQRCLDPRAAVGRRSAQARKDLPRH